jgi:hypothetical protein
MANPMKASRKSRRLVAVLVALGVLSIAPVAHAAWPPKWLLAPHHKYTLDYEASRSSHGTAVESFPEEPRCEHYVVTSQGSSSSHVSASYQVVFGGARVRTLTGTHIQFALAWRLKHKSTTGQDSATAYGSIPTNCPNYTASTDAIGGPVNASCSDRLKGGGLEVEVAGLPLANPKRFGLELTPETETTPQACSVDNPFAPNLEVWPKHFEPIYPTIGTIAFTKAGILARKTFHGTIATRNGAGNSVTPHDSHGTDPEGGGEGQSVWGVETSSTDDLTLTPANGRR